MLTTQLSSDGAPLTADWIEYDRTLDSAARVVRRQRVRTVSHPTTHAFRSVSADALHEKGYVVEDNTGVNYYAPDATVLLSDTFTSDHCFHLVTSPESREKLLGIAFTPASDRRNAREIDGTLWVDRASSELRLLEFRYLNQPDVTKPARPGGLVEFTRLGDGNWLVSKWSVRMPDVGTRLRASTGITGQMQSVSNVGYLRALQVTGGEVTQARRGDSILFRGIGPAIVLQVTAPDSAMRIAGTTLTLEGTDYSALADSTGRIRLRPVLAGRYRARVRSPLMELLGIPPAEREIETHDDAHVDSLALPARNTVVASICPKDSIQKNEGMLYGRVRDERASALANIDVTVSWQDAFVIVNQQHLDYSEQKVAARTDAFGFWRVCGVPVGTSVFAAAATDSGMDQQRVRLNDQPFAAVDLVLHKRTLLSSDIGKAARPAARALMEITVMDDKGNVMPDVALDVQPVGMPLTHVLTGASGRALVPDVRMGNVTIATRQAGYKSGTVSVSATAEHVAIRLRLSPSRDPQAETSRMTEGSP